MPAVSLVAVSALALFVVVLASLAYWVYADASARGVEQPGRLAAWSVLVAPYLLYYLLARRRSTERTRPLGRREHVAGTVALAGVAAFVLGAALAPPDPLTQVQYWVGGTVAAVPVAYVTLAHGEEPTEDG